MPITIRAADRGDADLVAQFIEDLAEYEKLDARAHPDAERLEDQLGKAGHPRLYCYLAYDGATPVGFAIGYLVYSTFQTTWNLHLEDIYVRETVRGTGAGRALFARMCKLAGVLGCEHLDLEVLKWNVSSIAIYEHWGGVRDDEWSRMRFDRETMEQFLLAA